MSSIRDSTNHLDVFSNYDKNQYKTIKVQIWSFKNYSSGNILCRHEEKTTKFRDKIMIEYLLKSTLNYNTSVKKFRFYFENNRKGISFLDHSRRRSLWITALTRSWTDRRTNSLETILLKVIGAIHYKWLKN